MLHLRMDIARSCLLIYSNTIPGPLRPSIIRATAARLKKRYDDPARPDERFDFITEEVDRLNAVLSGYLGFARDEPPQMEKMDLVPLLERALRLMQPPRAVTLRHFGNARC